MNKQIVVLASTYPRWPYDTTPPFVFELSRRLAKQFSVHVFAPHDKGAKRREVTDSVSVRRYRYFWPDSLELLCYRGGILPNIKRHPLLYIEGITLIIAQFMAVSAYARKHAIDVIHAHWIIPQGIVAWSMRLLFHIPYVITAHGGDVYGLNHPVVISVKRLILSKASRIIVVSRDLKRTVHSSIAPGIPVDVVPMGVDSHIFSPDKRDPSIRTFYHVRGPLLLFVGRLAEKKGVIYLLQAMKRIVRKLPSTVLLIIGEGPLEQQLQQLMDSLKIRDNVIFAGAIPNHDLPRYYATADIFIGPSLQIDNGDSEGLGLTFVEAALCGCIPVGTTAGGIKDVIEDGKTGFIVPQKDADAIARVTVSVLTNKRLRDRIRSRLPSLARTFDWGVVRDKYRKLFAQL